MFFRNIVLVFITAATLKAQVIEAWSGEVANGNDTRTFTLEITDQNNVRKINWSLSGANIYRMPVGEIYYEEEDTLSVSLVIFNHPVGKLEGRFLNNTFKGNLLWYKNSYHVSFKKISDYDIPYYEKEYKIINKEVTLAGTFIVPKGSGSFPAVVFLHGSGPAERWWAMYYAKEFAKIGIASFLYDKRGSGESTGNWVTSSLDDLASDAAAAINFLKKLNEVNGERIGVYAVSQGGWVTSKLAVSNTPPAFAIVNSGGAATPYEEEIYSYKKSLEHGSFSKKEKEDAMNLVKEYLQYLRSGKNRETLIQKINKVKNKNWYKFINIERVLPSNQNRKNWEWVSTYNPLKDIEKIHFPVMIVMGGNDNEQPVETTVKKWRSGLEKAGNKNHEIKIFEAAGHGLQLGRHGNLNSFPLYAKGSLEYQIEWLMKNIIE